MTKARPIIFSAPMVLALLEGRKTQTRRIVKCRGGLVRGDHWAGPARPYSGRLVYREGAAWDDSDFVTKPIANCPYGKPRDLLWVKETWAEGKDGPEPEDAVWPIYAAEYRDGSGAYRVLKPWRSALYMPRKYSRLTLEVTNVCVHKLRSISDEDAGTEGFSCADAFHDYWFEIHPIKGECYQGDWQDDPWVWAISFKVYQRNIDHPTQCPGD